MKKKINIAKGLIGITSVLLIVFQAWWLQVVYKNSFLSVKREIGVVLRESLVKEQMQFFLGDSTITFISKDGPDAGNNRVSWIRQGDTIEKSSPWPPNDSLKIHIQLSESPLEGKKRNARPRMRTMNPMDQEDAAKPPMVVTLPISKKILENGKLPEKYAKALKDAGLPHVYTLKKSERTPFGRELRLPARPNNTNRPSFELILMDLDFGNPVGHILSGMYGQIAFSLFMSAMVLLAFWFMYKNLRDQLQLAILKNDFVSNMAHELKTPVATVSVAIEALKSFDVLDNPQKTSEYLTISSLELNRLSLLIDKVLRINLFESGKWQLEMKDVDLSGLTQEVLQAQQLQVSRVKGTLEFVQAKNPIWVKGDKIHLMSVLYNLIDNAIKYRREVPHIIIQLEESEKQVVWKVTDNGLGIDEKFTEKIFEKFFRVPQGDRHDVKGYGLGLSYVSEVVQKHGGKILVQSEPGKGSTFTIVLPKLPF